MCLRRIVISGSHKLDSVVTASIILLATNVGSNKLLGSWFGTFAPISFARVPVEINQNLISVSMYSLLSALIINLLDWIESIKGVAINTRRNHGMKIVWTKDPLSQSFRLTMGEYSEGTLHKVGQRGRDIIISTLKMIRPGYFLLTIPHNSKSHNHNMRYTILTTTYVHLEVKAMI